MVENKAFSFQKADPDLQSELEAFRGFLKEKGYRITREREAIAEAVLQNHGHFDVDELFFHLKSVAGVSKASIYRTIPILIESGLLVAVYLEDGHMHYERTSESDQHSHLRCIRCGRIFEFTVPELSVLEQSIAAEKGFKSEGHKFEIWGRCLNCLE